MYGIWLKSVTWTSRWWHIETDWRHYL